MTPTEPRFELAWSRHFPDWLAEHNLSLAFTTYQAGKLFLLGRLPDGRVSVFERTFNRCMGLWADGQTLWVSTLYQLWKFVNFVPPGASADGHDRLYVPLVAHTTGDVDVHDVAVDAGGRVLFVSTLFGCVATVAERASFRPLWMPPWQSALAAGDRCHLNGLALADGRPRYVTAVSRSDVPDGWRDQRRDGGVLVDLADNRVVLEGLSMPHSPRVHRGAVWLHDSGRGYLGRLDDAGGTFERVAFCPGYLRGLALWGDFAVVGLSGPRRDRTFAGLELDDELARRGAEPFCGLQVIDLRTGAAVHEVRLAGVVQELYDVAVLPGVVRPAALGFKTEEIHRTLALEGFGAL